MGRYALVKFATDRPYFDPEKAARRLMEHAQAFEPIQEGRIYIEKINGPFLFGDKGSPAEYSAGLKLAIDRGWLVMHESGTFVRLTQSGDLGASRNAQHRTSRMSLAGRRCLRHWPPSAVNT